MTDHDNRPLPRAERIRQRALNQPLSRAGLWVLSLLFRALVRLRLVLFRFHLLPRRRLPVPVISVGNLTAGGSGKTPLVIALAEALTQRGYRVAVVSRGFGGRRSEDPAVVHDGARLRMAPAETGDEPVMIAEALTDIPIVVGRNRANAGQLAIKHFSPNLILLDDGFQHLRLARDVDILTFHGDVPPERHLLPLGLLREPWRSLRRAHAVVITSGRGRYAGELEMRIRRIAPRIAVYHCARRAASLREFSSGTQHPLSALAGRRVFAFAGIAYPETFFAMLEELGGLLVHSMVFPDHYSYSPEDVTEVMSAAREADAALITTAKDGVRLRGLTIEGFACLILDMRCDFGAEADHLLHELTARIDAAADEIPGYL